MRLYVGNLSYGTTEDDLRDLFSEFGEVASVAVIKDRETGRSKGFGFVEFSSDDEGSQAVEGTDGKEYQGRALKVNEARPREGGGGGGGGGRGFGGGGGGRSGGGGGGFGRDRRGGGGGGDWH